MSPPRTRRLVEEWPAADQDAWARACRPARLFAGRGRATRWSSTTRRNAEKGYGLYIAYLEGLGQIDLHASPAGRLGRELLEAYADALIGRLKSSSIADRLRDLHEAVRVMWPDTNHEDLRVLVRHWQAIARRDERIAPTIVSPSDIFEAGLQRMKRVSEAVYEKRDVQAVQFGDGLMMSMLASKPLRPRNLRATRIGVHLLSRGPVYEWRFDATETKTYEPIRAELPAVLTPAIETWISKFRPVLLAGRESDAMWISCYRQPMAASTIAARFRAAMEDELGVALSAHHVRHCVATGVAIGMPGQVRMVPYLLDHRSDATLRKHYNLADTLSASAKYVGVLETRRARAFRKR